MDYPIVDFTLEIHAPDGCRVDACWLHRSLLSDDYAVFLRLLREARIDAGVTQAELGARLKQTQSFVSKCERGERRLDIAEVRAICLALDIPLSVFVNRFSQSLRSKGS